MRHWSAKYLSIEYKNMNCSKFVEHVLRDHFGIDYNFPQSEGSLFNQSNQIKKHVPELCIETSEYKDGDLVLMNGKRSLCHVGMYLRIKGADYVLHCESSLKTAALHRFSDIIVYGFSIAGVYTWRK